MLVAQEERCAVGVRPSLAETSSAPHLENLRSGWLRKVLCRRFGCCRPGDRLAHCPLNDHSFPHRTRESEGAWEGLHAKLVGANICLQITNQVKHAEEGGHDRLSEATSIAIFGQDVSLSFVRLAFNSFVFCPPTQNGYFFFEGVLSTGGSAGTLSVGC